MINTILMSLAGSVLAIIVLGGGRPVYFFAADSLAAVSMGVVVSVISGGFSASGSAFSRAARCAFFAGALIATINGALVLSRAPDLGTASPRLALALTGLLYGALAFLALQGLKHGRSSPYSARA